MSAEKPRRAAARHAQPTAASRPAALSYPSSSPHPLHHHPSLALSASNSAGSSWSRAAGRYSSRSGHCSSTSLPLGSSWYMSWFSPCKHPVGMASGRAGCGAGLEDSRRAFPLEQRRDKGRGRGGRKEKW